jgi:hypothetical protein
MGVQALALLAALDAACAGADQLAEATADAFAQHPDHAIITSFPGLADTAGARVLAEIGDDRTRFTDPRALKAYAGSAPVTRASGRSLVITRRRIKNDRLASAGWTWAFASLTHSPRGASPLRPPPNRWRPARGGAAPPVQPLPRPTPPLSDHRPALHRGHSLPADRVIGQRQPNAHHGATFGRDEHVSSSDYPSSAGRGW